jgi:two-component system, sensor histidine kinase
MVAGGQESSRRITTALVAATTLILHPRRSLGGKLMVVVLTTTAIALLAAGAALLLVDVRDSRATASDDLETEAAILSLAVQAAMSFEDIEGAQRNLDALRARTSIQAAALYAPDGTLFAAYARPTETPAPTRAPDLAPGLYVGGGRVELVKLVIQGGETLGTMYLRADYDVSGRLRAYLSVLVGAMAIGLIAALLAASWLQRALSQPMKSMANAARQITEKRDYSFRAVKTTDDEIGVVIDAFNKMLDEVQSRSLALEKADQLKDEFLATLAHELRNPLAPIRNAVRILDSEASNVGQRKWGREVIARQVHRMSLLLDDLLDVSRITRGQFELKKDYVELKWLISVAVETARPLIDSKQHQLRVDLPDEPITLEVDPLRISQVVGNLLTNAAKYTDPHGNIELQARAEEGGLVITVRDNGIGLSEDALPTLFTMFSQVNSAVDRAEGGLGIGLALVKGLVTLHGGRVEVRSEGLGRGSEFSVRLPPNLLAPSNVIAEKAGHTDDRHAERRARVLVVDDNRDAAESLGMLLSVAGYDVSIAYSGLEGLEVAARDRPHAAILDIGMPSMSGHEVARRMRREAWGHSTVLIALTGWGQDHDKQAARASGFNEHLTKPVDPDELGRVLAILLSRNAQESSGSTAATTTR